MPPAFESQKARALDALFEQVGYQQTFGRYVILDPLGEGGMGVVLRAFDRELDRPIALKVLHEDLDEKHSARLRREAQAMAKLSHPNVVQVYEVGRVEGRTFVAMELIKGKSVDQWVRQVPRPDWRTCVKMFIQLGEGLAAAHAKGLVHRDFKPGNAIIDQGGRARVLDFGLARCGDEGALDEVPRSASSPRASPIERVALETPLTRTGAVLGTPAYMPPEQMSGQEADPRSDQFSFCVSLYESVYGERPFDGGTLAQLGSFIEAGKIRPKPRGSNVPHALRATLVRGLAAAPDDRWPSMTVLLEQLERVVLEHTEPADALPLFERTLSLCTTHEIDPSLLATTRFVLARTLWAAPTPQDHDEAGDVHKSPEGAEREEPAPQHGSRAVPRAATHRWNEIFDETDSWLTNEGMEEWERGRSTDPVGSSRTMQTAPVSQAAGARAKTPAARDDASTSESDQAPPQRLIRRYIDLTEVADEQLRALKQVTGASSLSEVLCNALAVYEFFVEHQHEGDDT